MKPLILSQSTSEPRTQRSGVSGRAMPLTPLRCVRGSDGTETLLPLAYGHHSLTGHAHSSSFRR
jgi:hypothetical protein